MFLNFTPHQVNILNDVNEVVVTFVSVGNARCKQTTTQEEIIDDIPISKTSFGEVEGLPESTPNTFYIVSRLIKSALPNRTDLVVPNEIISNEKVIILGCKSLAIN